MRNTACTALFAALALCACINCGSDNDIAGTTSGGETSTVAGYVRSIEGTPVRNADVYLRPSSYVAPIVFGQSKAALTPMQTTTDSAGYFQLDSIDRGSYRIEVAGNGDGSLTDLQLVSDTTLSDQIVLPWGTLVGSVPVQSAETYVQVYGLDRTARIDPVTGYFTLARMPAATVALRFVDADSAAYPSTSVWGVSVRPADTTSVATALPAPWVAASVGREVPLGSSVLVDGQYVITGGGPDIWGRADAFQFVYQPWTGDGEIIAHVTSFDYGREYFSKAGVQFRASLDPSAQHIALSLEIDDLDRHIAALHFRKNSGDSASIRSGLDSVSAPAWVRMVRTGDVFVGLTSRDGMIWDTVGVDTVAMPSTVIAGLAVTSHDTTRVSTAVFDSARVW